MSSAEIGVFGGSGFYSFLEDAEEVTVDTPYGPTSDRFVIGDVGGRRVAFLPRHGRNHSLPPHAIPYRANLWAMRELGVRRRKEKNRAGEQEGQSGQQAGLPPDVILDRLYLSCGLKRSSSSRWKRFGWSGFGSGEDLRIARSMASS